MCGAKLGCGLEQQARRGIFAKLVEMMPGAESADIEAVMIDQCIQPESVALVRQQCVQLGTIHGGRSVHTGDAVYQSRDRGRMQ